MESKITGGRESAGRGDVLPISVCLVYPNRREVGMSYLGFHKIYAALSGICRCDAAFLPEEGQKSRSHFTDTPLSDFDIVAFSITFEMDIFNVLSILRGAGLPLKREGRTHHHPLVCAGGIVPTMNPEPVSDFFDFLVLGEGELTLRQWLEKLSDSSGRPRGERLAEIANVEGVYVPSLYDVSYGEKGEVLGRTATGGAPERVKRLYDRRFGIRGSSQLAGLGDTVFKDSWLMETGKGCGQGCRFCAAGFIYRPVRHVETETLFRQVDEGLSRKKRIGLIGSAICEHPRINDLYAYILQKGGGINVSSLRLGYVDKKMVAQLVAGGLKTMTIAPEAGSERLRRAVNKDVSDGEILATVADAVEAGMMNVKMYFLIGLPGEEDGDITALVSLVKKIRDLFVEKSKPLGRAGKVTAGIHPFVPKPQTPFQWEPLAPLAGLKKKTAFLRKSLARESNVELRMENPKNAAVQALLSVGSRRVGELALEAFAEGSWNTVMKKELAVATYSRAKGRDEMLPWDFIDSGFTRDYLWKEHEKCFAGRVTPPCPPERSGCKRCGDFEGNCY